MMNKDEKTNNNTIRRIKRTSIYDLQNVNNKIRDDLKSNSEQSNEGKNNNIVIKKNVEFDVNFNKLVERANKIFKAYYKEDEDYRNIVETKNIEQDFDRNEIFEGKNIEEFLVYKIINMAEYLFNNRREARIYGIEFKISPDVYSDNAFFIEFTITDPSYSPKFIKRIEMKTNLLYNQKKEVVSSVNHFFKKNNSKYLGILYYDEHGNSTYHFEENGNYVQSITKDKKFYTKKKKKFF